LKPRTKVRPTSDEQKHDVFRERENHVVVVSSDSPKVPLATPRYRVRRDPEKDESSRRVAVVFILSAILLVFSAALLTEPPVAKNQNFHQRTPTTVGELMRREARPMTFEDRVNVYADETGYRVNRDRIRAQYDNLDASVMPDGRVPFSADRVLTGVPIEGQKNTYPQDFVAPPRRAKSPEAEVLFRSQLAKDLDRWEKAARDAYIQEFISNARAMGYEVHIDQDYNVEYYQIDANSAPQPNYRRGPSSGGAVR